MVKNSDSTDDQKKEGGQDEKESKTRVIGIVSGKGGVGKTTFSANMGIALNAFGFKTLVVDCNVTTPHLSYYMGAKNSSTTINNIFSGDVDAVFAPLDKNGVMFIPASDKFEDLKDVDMKDLKIIIGRIVDTERFDFIILDSAPGLGREAMGALHACDEIIFITKPTAPNVMDIARCDEVARMIGHKKFYMVFNMVQGKDYEMPPEKAEDIFKMPFLGSIPFDENVMDSTANGMPIMWFKPDAPSCDYFMEIAARLAGINLDELIEDKRGKDGEAGSKDETGSDEEVVGGYEGFEFENHIGDFSRSFGRIEPIIDAGYGFVERRSKQSFSSRLRSRLDGAAGGIAKKIKGRIWK